MAYEFFEDLGALFWIDTMHFILDGASLLDDIFVDISDGTRAPDGSIKWTRVASSQSSTGGFQSARGPRFREFRIDPAQVRFIRAPFQSPNVGSLHYIAFTEVMLYGQGFVPEVELTSDLIQLGG